jgi:hypothetical protein
MQGIVSWSRAVFRQAVVAMDDDDDDGDDVDREDGEDLLTKRVISSVRYPFS